MGQSASKESDQDMTAAPGSWPIVYERNYDLRMMGFEKLSKFDTRKSENISRRLVKDFLAGGSFSIPTPPTDSELEEIHTKEYLDSLKAKANIASITGIAALKMMPASFVFDKIVAPFRLQAGGTVMAVKLSVDHGWAINLGGGQHHCSHDRATPGGFSMYADITMAVRYMQKNIPGMSKALIVDLDAHQGNGYARDFIDDDSVFIFDVYNSEIFPQDEDAKASVRKKIEIKTGVADEEYLTRVSDNIENVLDEYHPDFVVYNAGVDILKGDPLGLLRVSLEGVIKRDAVVFRTVRARAIPIAMLLSGGFTKIAAETVANSIINLHKEGLISTGRKGDQLPDATDGTVPTL